MGGPPGGCRPPMVDDMTQTAFARPTRAAESSERTQEPTSARAVHSAPAVLAAIALVLISVRITLPHQVPLALVYSALIAPLWVPALRRFRFMTFVFAGGFATLLSGVVLAIAHQPVNGFNRTDAIAYGVLLLNLVTSIGMLLWARTILKLPDVLLLFGVGLVIGIVPLDSQYSENPWKFSFAFPVAVVLLALAMRFRRLWVEIVVLVALMGYSATHDFRSMFGEMLLAVLVVLVIVPLRASGRTGSKTRIVVGMAALAVIVYFVGQQLIVSGALGAATAARSVLQIQTAGSLILGGRPELAATVALMSHYPSGFGLGSNLTAEQLLTAQSGMSLIGYDPNNGYVTSFMFGGHIELHSVVGDLWAHFGIAGILYALVLIVVMVVGVARRIAHRDATAVMVFVVAQSVWFMFFGPLLSSRTSIVLAIGLVAVPVVRGVRDGTTRHRRYVKEPSWPTPETTTSPGARVNPTSPRVIETEQTAPTAVVARPAAASSSSPRSSSSSRPSPSS